MSNWIEKVMDAYERQQREDVRRAKDEQKRIEQENEARERRGELDRRNYWSRVRPILIKTLNMYNPEQLLSDVRSRVWKVGVIEPYEGIDEKTKRPWRSLALVHYYPAIFRESRDPGSGDRLEGHESKGVMTEKLAIGVVLSTDLGSHNLYLGRWRPNPEGVNIIHGPGVSERVEYLKQAMIEDCRVRGCVLENERRSRKQIGGLTSLFW